MLKFIILLVLLINMNAFITIKKSRLNFNILYDSPSYPNMKYNEFDINKKTYTILSSYNNKIKELINILEMHKVNYVFIDIYLYSVNDIKEICKYYSIEIPNSCYNSVFVFLEDKKYIGNEFELYEIILRY